MDLALLAVVASGDDYLPAMRGVRLESTGGWLDAGVEWTGGGGLALTTCLP